MNFLSKILVTTWVGIQSLFGFGSQPQAVQQPTITLGDFNPTGGQTYRLQSSISSTQNTITLSSFKEPVSGIKYTMSYLNTDVIYGTLDPQNSTSKEFVSATGITQNADGTATLTGVSRGLGFSYPYTASTTLAQAHSGQSIFILSNSPQLYNRYYNLSNVSTSTNILWFSSTTPPRLDSVAGQSAGSYIATTSEFVTWAGLQAVALSGVSNATESVRGVGELATQIEMASSTATGSTGASLLLYSKYSTSSPYTTGLWIPTTQNDGKLSPLFIATSSSYLYNWGAGHMFTASTTFAANSSNKVSFNTQAYVFPSSQLASSTVLMTNGSGGLSWQRLTQVLYINSASLTTSQTGTTSLATVALPADTLNTTGRVIAISALTSGNGGGGNCHFGINYGTGSATTTIGYTNGLFAENFTARINATTTTSEIAWASAQNMGNNGLNTTPITYVFSSYPAVNTTAISYIDFNARTDTTATCKYGGITIELLQQ